MIEPNDLEHLQPSQIIQQANSILNSYLISLPETSGDALTDEPAKLLHNAARLLASAINKHPTSYKLHFRLAQLCSVASIPHNTFRIVKQVLYVLGDPTSLEAKVTDYQETSSEKGDKVV